MFKSKEELYTSWFFEELKDKGFVDSIEYEPETFILTEPVYVEVQEQLKTKTKTKQQFLMHGSEYTPDFKITFNTIPDCLKNNLFIQNNIWRIDVKGTFTGLHNNSAITFPLTSKFLYYRYGILVEKFIPVKQFAKLGTPLRYLKTDGGEKTRKINFAIKEIR